MGLRATQFVLEGRFAPSIQSRLLTQRIEENCSGRILAASVEPCVACAMDLAHPSRSQRRLNLIRPEFASRCEAHFFFSSASQFRTIVMGAEDPSPAGTPIKKR